MTDQEVPQPEDSPTTHPGEWGTFDPARLIKDRGPLPELFEQPEPVEDQAPAFDEKYKQPFTGLLYIGALTDKFDFLGHEIVVRTLLADDDLATGEVTKEWMGTAAAERAYITAVVAMCLVSVDGKEPPTPIGPDTSTNYAWAYQRFNWVKANLFSATIERIYQRYVALEQTSREVLEEMEKASGSSSPTSQTPQADPALWSTPMSPTIADEPTDSDS